MLQLKIIYSPQCIADLFNIPEMTYNKPLGVLLCFVKELFCLASENPLII